MDERRVKHLELIQAVITRFGTTSFVIKGWALTVSGALYGYTVNDPTWDLALVALFPALPFWFLDTFFLYNERLFRQLYDDVRRADSDVEPFSMDVGPYRETSSWWRAAGSITFVVFYGAIVAVGLGIVVVSLWST